MVMANVFGVTFGHAGSKQAPNAASRPYENWTRRAFIAGAATARGDTTWGIFGGVTLAHEAQAKVAQIHSMRAAPIPDERGVMAIPVPR
jgi:hypothetical protein